MEDTWHFRPIPDHHPCPVCSISHYPFCPQSPPFSGDNLRFFPSDLRLSHFHRPFQDLSHPPPFPAPQTNGSAPFQPPFQSSFLHDDVRDRESFRKRMRMEDPAIEVFHPFEPYCRTMSVEDERRLNLVRNHGRQGSDGYHWNNSSGYRMDRHTFDSEQKHFYSPAVDHTLPELDIDHNRNGYSHANTFDDYRNQPISNLNRGDRFLIEEKRDFKHVEFKSDGRGMYDVQVGDCYSYETSAQLHKISQVPRSHRSYEALDGSEEFLSSAPRRSFLNDSFRTTYSSIENPLLVGDFHDQHKYHSTLSNSPLLTTPDNYRSEPYREGHAAQSQMERKYEIYNQQGDMGRTSFYHQPLVSVEINRSLDSQSYLAVEQLGLHSSKQAGSALVTTEVNHLTPTLTSEHGHTSKLYPSTPIQSHYEDVNHMRGTSIPDHGHTSQACPSVPPQPLFPIQTEQPSSSFQVTSSSSTTISLASPVGGNTLAKKQLSSQGSQSLPQGEFYNEPCLQGSNGFAIEGSPFICQSSSKLEQHGPTFLAKHTWKEEPAYVHASHLFKQPYRASRPDHIVIILRGLPGSGKSYLAKALRDIEVDNGGSAPRIHAMDDYFMMEVEKKVEDDVFKSGSAKSKKQITKKVIEYCYEPEMEEAYRSSMLKAFKKTLEDGNFTLVIVDDRNLRVADFAQFWAIAKRTGYEVYLLEAAYKDPAGCAARNIHGFKLSDIQEMAKQWEEAPPLYLHLDIQSLFGGDDLIDQSIQEVDMDADDTVANGVHVEETVGWNSTELKLLDQGSDYESTNLGKRWSTEEVEVTPEKNDLQKCKWSEDLSVNLHGRTMENTSALSGLIQAYGKDAKIVHWGDNVESTGFSIGANKKQSASSLIIGPGAGYNLKSNPLLEETPFEEDTKKTNTDTKRRFSEQLRAERESFRAVFDRRRHRVGGLWDADDD